MSMKSSNPHSPGPVAEDLRGIAELAVGNLASRLDTSGIASLEVQGLDLLSGDKKVFELVLKPTKGGVEKLSAIVSRSFDRYGLLRFKEQMDVAEKSAGLGEPGVARRFVVTGFMPAALGEELKALGVCFADSVGNVYLKTSNFPVFLDIRKTDRNPYKQTGRPLRSLKGEPSALVVRGLVDQGAPIRVSDLIDKTGVSRASAYRTLDFLEASGLIERSAPGVVRSFRTRALLEVISEGSGFSNTGTSFRFIAPKGIQDVLKKLKGLSGYAITGSVAASNWYPHAAAQNLFLYSDTPQKLALTLGLMESDSGADVVINRPSFQGVYQQMTEFDKLQFVAPSQIAIDLLGGPSRNPEEGKMLLNWMLQNESLWRSGTS
jgi:hypothetical protein